MLKMTIMSIAAFVSYTHIQGYRCANSIACALAMIHISIWQFLSVMLRAVESTKHDDHVHVHHFNRLLVCWKSICRHTYRMHCTSTIYDFNCWYLFLITNHPPALPPSFDLSRLTSYKIESFHIIWTLCFVSVNRPLNTHAHSFEISTVWLNRKAI